MNRVMHSRPSYSAAFRCHDCPQSNGADGCPKWVEMVETNDMTGEERMSCGCVDQMFTLIAVNLIKSANRPAAEISAMRDDVAKRMELATAHVLNTVHAQGQTKPITLLGRLRQLMLPSP